MNDAASKTEQQEFLNPPQTFRKENMSDMLQKLEVLPPEIFFKFFREHVQHYGPNWIVRNPQNPLASWRLKVGDTLPSVRHPNRNLELSEKSHFLWTKEFVSKDNFLVYQKMIKTDLDRDTLFKTFSENDFNFLIYWGTLIASFEKVHPGVLPADLVFNSSLLLGYLHHINKAKIGETLKHKDPDTLGQTSFKYRQKLAIYENGTSYSGKMKKLAEGDDGANYLALVNLLVSKVPLDLETHGDAGNYYNAMGGTKKYQAMDADRDQNLSEDLSGLPEEEQESVYRNMAFAAAMNRRESKGNAYYRTESNERFTFKRIFKDLINEVREITDEDDPEFLLPIEDNTDKQKIQDILSIEYVMVGHKIGFSASQLETALNNILKSVTVKTWDKDRMKLLDVIYILRKACARKTSIRHTNQFANDEYEGIQIHIREQDIPNILNELKTFITEDIVKEKNFEWKQKSQPLKDKVRYFLTGKTKDHLKDKPAKADLHRRPNYPVFGAVAMATVFSLVGVLESQSPHLQWGVDAQKSISHMLDVATSLFANPNAEGGGLKVAETSESAKAVASNPLYEPYQYQPENDPLSAEKDKDQAAVFGLEINGKTPWSIPYNSELYSFDKTNPFKIEWRGEKLERVGNSRILFETFNENPPLNLDLSEVIDMKKVGPKGLLVPLSIKENVRFTLHVRTSNAEILARNQSANGYEPDFMIGENGGVYLFFPPLLETSNTNPDSSIVVEVVQDKSDNIDSQFGNQYLIPGVSFTTENMRADGGKTKEDFFNTYQEVYTHFSNEGAEAEVQPGPELRQFLIDQGFDLNKMTQIVDDIEMPPGSSLSLDTAESARRRKDAEVALYTEVTNQMKALGFRYSNDTSLNKFLSKDDIRSYFIVGKNIGLDCDGLAFVANVVAKLGQGVDDTMVNTEIIFAEADTNQDQKFSGQLNHAQIRLRADDNLLTTFEVTDKVPLAGDKATAEEIQKSIDQIQDLLKKGEKGPTAAENTDTIVNALALLMVSLTAILVARESIEKAKKKFGKIGSPKEVSHLVKAKAHKLEARTTERLIPAFKELTPAQLAKVPEVLSILLSPNMMPLFENRYNSEDSDKKGYNQEKVKQLLQSFELDERIAVPKQIEQASNLPFLTKKMFEARSNGNFRKTLLACIDSVIDTNSSQPGMDKVLFAIKTMLI